jgi:hypothetical protein
MVYTDKDRRSQPKTSTLGWELCVSWVDDSSSWLPLALVKDSNPIEAAEYAVSRDLDLEPSNGESVKSDVNKINGFVKSKQGTGSVPISMASN